MKKLTYKLNYILIFILFIVKLLDITISIYFVRELGYFEINPLYNMLFKTELGIILLYIGLIITIGLMLYSNRFFYKHLNYFLIILSFITIIIFIINFINLIYLFKLL